MFILQILYLMMVTFILMSIAVPTKVVLRTRVWVQFLTLCQ